ncbi:MAG: CBS domain-containing protein, partial [Bacteroidales bacterium]|nr:CBS domain-containing protein [Bacteroidales bacterium]
SMMTLDRVIETNFIIMHPDDNLGALVKSISRSSRNLFPVTDEQGNFLGVVFLDDIKTVIFRPDLYEQIYVKDLMYVPSLVIERHENMAQVAKKFQQSDKYNIAVLDHGKYVGFISRANVFSSYRAKVKEYSSD